MPHTAVYVYIYGNCPDTRKTLLLWQKYNNYHTGFDRHSVDFSTHCTEKLISTHKSPGNCVRQNSCVVHFSQVVQYDCTAINFGRVDDEPLTN